VDELVQEKYNEINTMKEKINNLSQETEIE
jgi:hypothetical protein